jgi:flagellar motor switch protein FliN/FliY
MTALSPTADETTLARSVAAAAAGVLPAPQPVTPADPQPGTPDVVAPFAGAVLAPLEGAVPGRVAVLVNEDLVAALASSPLGGLDLAAAVQPTIDAVAAALGSSAGAAQQVELELVVGDLAGSFTALPLLGDGFVAAVLVQDATLRAAVRTDAGATPAGRPAPLGTVIGAPSASAAGSAPAGALPRRGIELLHGVDMEVTVEIGRTRMTVRDLLALAPGAVLELDRAAGSPADLLVNGRLIARGEVVVVDEDFGLRVTEIVTDQATG